MKKIIKFLKLPYNDKRAVVRLFYHLMKATVIMRVFPYSCTKRLVCKKAKKLKRPQPDAAQILRRYILLLSSICKSLPWEITCLRKAVALRDALHAAGVDSVIRLGVNRGEATIAAHAWLECCGSEVLKNGTYSELRLDSV